MSKSHYYVFYIFTALIIGYSHWAKDIIFVVGDGHLEGMQAWLAAYHGAPQSSTYGHSIHLSAKLKNLFFRFED